LGNEGYLDKASRGLSCEEEKVTPEKRRRVEAAPFVGIRKELRDWFGGR